MVALKVWPMSLGTVSEWMLLIFLVIKVSTEDHHLLNLAKCHCPRLSGLHGVNPGGFSWSGRLYLFLFLQENKLQIEQKPSKRFAIRILQE